MKWFKNFFRQDGVIRCGFCGRARNTIASIRRHMLRKHIATVYTKK